MKSKYILILILFLIFIFSSKSSCERVNMKEKSKKTIIIIVDELDFKLANRITSSKGAIGVINNRTSSLYKGDGKESFYLTIATGRRLKVRSGIFGGVKEKSDGKLQVVNYNEILTNTMKNNSIYRKDEVLFSEYFSDNHISIGYIGNDISSILAADKNGIIKYGYKDINYDINWLEQTTENLLKNIEILIINFKTSNQQNIPLLKNYIQKLNDKHILLISDNISENMSKKFNKTLGLIIYISPDNKKGLLSSNTTKRSGIITNLDILPHISSIYGLEESNFIGNKMEVSENIHPIRILYKRFNQYINLNIIKYIFHLLLIIGQLYVMYHMIIKNKEITKNNNNKCDIAINSIIISIILSFLIGLFDFYNTDILVYIMSIVVTSLTVSYFLHKKGLRTLYFFSGILNLMITYGVFFHNEIIYSSYIGYNNILAGGRFYGLNNGILGVLLGSGIMFYFGLKKLFKNNAIIKYTSLIIFPIMILALTGNYGANTGGFITSIVLFTIVIYYEIFKEYKKDKGKIKKIIVLIILGIMVISFSFYIDMTNNSSHVGSLIKRTLNIGYLEVVDLFIKKIKQLIFMIIVPPWSIILVIQLYFINKIYKLKGNVVKEKKEGNIKYHRVTEIDIILITSIIGLLINDTGVITFTYMNIFLVAKVASLHNIEKR